MTSTAVCLRSLTTKPLSLFARRSRIHSLARDDHLIFHGEARSAVAIPKLQQRFHDGDVLELEDCFAPGEAREDELRDVYPVSDQTQSVQVDCAATPGRPWGDFYR
jgi:hypothetical protein